MPTTDNYLNILYDIRHLIFKYVSIEEEYFMVSFSLTPIGLYLMLKQNLLLV